MLAACQTLYFTMAVRHKCLIYLCSITSYDKMWYDNSSVVFQTSERMLTDIQNGILDLLLQLKSKYKCDLRLETCEECFDVIWNWNNKKIVFMFLKSVGYWKTVSCIKSWQYKQKFVFIKLIFNLHTCVVGYNDIPIFIDKGRRRAQRIFLRTVQEKLISIKGLIS